MAELSEVNQRAGNVADSPLFVWRLMISFLFNLLMMIPVSILSGCVTGFTVWSAYFLFTASILRERPSDFANVVSAAMSLSAGFVAGLLTVFYYFVQLDEDYAAARLRGHLRTRLTTRCPACRAALVFGQVVCKRCGKDLRHLSDVTQSTRDMQRLALVSFALATVPLANVTFVFMAVVADLVLAWFGLGRTRESISLACALSAAGCVIFLRVPRVIVRWRLLLTEEIESPARSTWGSAVTRL